MTRLIYVVSCFYAITSGQNTSMLNYTPLSNEAKHTGQLAKYDGAACASQTINVDGMELKINVPVKASAYDMIPVTYSLTKSSDNDGNTAIAATAFEEPEKTTGENFYDLNIPGDMGLKIEYLGSIGADYNNENYIPLTKDPKTAVSPFPPFNRDEFTASSTIKPADIIWFKFRITNTGNTIQDPEGFAGSFGEPFIYKFDDNGNEQWKGKLTNLFVRQLEYLYPGDSIEQWINFNCPALGAQCLGLSEGNYKINLRMVCRFYDKYDWMANIWSGTEFCRLEVPIKVSHQKEITPITSIFTMAEPMDRMPGYFGAFEEFMSSFHIISNESDKKVYDKVLYLQVAPWTKQISVKLIYDKSRKIAVVRFPIQIDDKTLRVKYNPRNMLVVEEDGKYEPAFVAQAMPAMRAGYQLGPYPETAMYEFLKEMKELGVNVVANTAGNWWIPEVSGRKGVEMHSACYKYFYDVLVRKLDMKVIGWSVYPPSAPHWYKHAENLLGKKIEFATVSSGYTSGPTSVQAVDMADPVVPEMIAAWVNYQYQRWGDTWFRSKDGRMPIDIEDTWGWMRDDINIRYGLGELGLKRMHQWLQNKYGNIAQLNRVWNSTYEDFADINPFEGQNMKNGGYTFDNRSLVFYDWNSATEDLDCFRTELRLEMYKKANEILQRTIPGAELAPRTEGANLIMKAAADDENMKWRHVYYSQRRNAFVYDVVRSKDVFHFYSDYTTMPFTPSQWREAIRRMVGDGVLPMFLPQFDHMRDILLNPDYGLDYQMHYNLEMPSKGVMVHCLMAAYPWWKATYEEGGAPGILWSDYLCDGFATQTQKHELMLLNEQFKLMDKQ
ncbi:hypothetical protein SMSP2_01291 [Limihaloglobus sulfuriphilus]|uniref:Beta-galactosidase n=1 Tax=Limihaloglobus sulfuriphilus TaxID=1851148 RepID=A0A1Q2MF57_9BACT|nr:hypothetical protein [Limihaloglobus sulfuriphilus]AQQ70927.1 hypothetical protein SMSP2_01291 [Limihaloglobus sulfuriphilus]